MVTRAPRYPPLATHPLQGECHGKPKILVTSAVGHTGRPATLQLLEQGFPVRAFVRSKDHRALALEQAGAEVFVGDLRDLRAALNGVQRAFHCPPFSQNTLYDSTLFAIAAEEAKLEVVALMGAWNPHATHPSIHQRGHWIAHQIYCWMPSVDVIRQIANLELRHLMLQINDIDRSAPERGTAAYTVGMASERGLVYRESSPKSTNRVITNQEKTPVKYATLS